MPDPPSKKATFGVLVSAVHPKLSESLVELLLESRADVEVVSPAEGFSIDDVHLAITGAESTDPRIPRLLVAVNGTDTRLELPTANCHRFSTLADRPLFAGNQQERGASCSSKPTGGSTTPRPSRPPVLRTRPVGASRSGRTRFARLGPTSVVEQSAPGWVHRFCSMTISAHQSTNDSAIGRLVSPRDFVEGLCQERVSDDVLLVPRR